MDSLIGIDISLINVCSVEVNSVSPKYIDINLDKVTLRMTKDDLEKVQDAINNFKSKQEVKKIDK